MDGGRTTERQYSENSENNYTQREPEYDQDTDLQQWELLKYNKLRDLWVGWDPDRPTTTIRLSKEHRHNPVMA